METPTLGARLKQARLKAGLTQKDAADALGVTYQAISNYERDKCRVQAGVLKQLCVLYHISATELLQGSSWDAGKAGLFDNAATDAERMSLYDLWGVPEDRQEEYAELRRRMGLAPSERPPEADLTGPEAELLRLFRQIPEENRTMVLDMIEAAVSHRGLRK